MRHQTISIFDGETRDKGYIDMTVTERDEQYEYEIAFTRGDSLFLVYKGATGRILRRKGPRPSYYTFASLEGIPVDETLMTVGMGKVADDTFGVVLSSTQSSWVLFLDAAVFAPDLIETTEMVATLVGASGPVQDVHYADNRMVFCGADGLYLTWGQAAPLSDGTARVDQYELLRASELFDTFKSFDGLVGSVFLNETTLCVFLLDETEIMVYTVKRNEEGAWEKKLCATLYADFVANGPFQVGRMGNTPYAHATGSPRVFFAVFEPQEPPADIKGLVSFDWFDSVMFAQNLNDGERPAIVAANQIGVYTAYEVGSPNAFPKVGIRDIVFTSNDAVLGLIVGTG